jgi:serine/threonine-protein kinase
MADAGESRVIGGRYRLDAVLGEGGMGVVYRAFDLSIERAVAVKLLRHDGAASPADVERFLREVRVTANVESAHSVTVFDVGQTPEGEPFLVMSLVDGVSLDAWLERNGTMAVGRAVGVALQVADALAAAHAVGVVHRDVKPANIMLREGPDGPSRDKVTVVDFGIAKWMKQKTALTSEGVIVGTVLYAAPEQISGEAVDGRADQYALAATLVRLVSGQDLFSSDEGIASVIHHHLMKTPVPLSQRVPLVPSGLDAVLGRALEKKPAARYPDMRAFADALRPFADAPPATATATRPPPSARPPSSAGRRLHAPELLLEGDDLDVRLEIDAPIHVPDLPLPAPTRPSFPPRVAADLRPLGRASADDALLAWLPPALWKRVLGYSVLALFLGRSCMPRAVSGAPEVLLIVLAVAGAAALGLRAWLTRDDLGS